MSWLSKWLTLIVNFISILICLNSSSFIMMWFFMEINLLTFVSFLNFNSCKFQSMASVKYFCVQALMSVSLLLGFLFFFFASSANYLKLLSGIILIKLGAAPFQSWFISVVAKVSWFSIFWLSTLQKIVPLLLLSLFLTKFVWGLVILSMIIVPFISAKQSSLKKLLGYSSVFSLNWLTSSMGSSKDFWFIFLCGYSLVLLSVMMVSAELGVSQNMKFLTQMNFYETLFLFVGVLSLMGIPPLTMFFLKLKVLSFFAEKFLVISILIILSSVCLMFMYFQMVIKYLTQHSFNLSHNVCYPLMSKKSGGFILLSGLSTYI